MSPSALASAQRARKDEYQQHQLRSASALVPPSIAAIAPALDRRHSQQHGCRYAHESWRRRGLL
eukprot:5434878-Pleurochrysis_carterae.AAC.1